MYGEYVKSKEAGDALPQSTKPEPMVDYAPAQPSTAKKRHVFGRSSSTRVVGPIRLDPELSEHYLDLARKERRSHGDLCSRNESQDWVPSNNTIPETLNSSKEWKFPNGMEKKYAASQNDVRIVPTVQVQATPSKHQQGSSSGVSNTFDKENFFTPRKNPEAQSASTPAQSRCPLSALPVDSVPSHDVSDGVYAQPAHIQNSSSISQLGSATKFNVSNPGHEHDFFRTPQCKVSSNQTIGNQRGRQRLYGYSHSSSKYELPKVPLHPAVVAGQQQAKQLQMQREAQDQLSAGPKEASTSRRLLDSTPFKSAPSASNSVGFQCQSRPTFDSSHENLASSKSWLSHTKYGDTTPFNATPLSSAANEKQLSPPMSATESTWLPESKFPHLYDRPKPVPKFENGTGAPTRSAGSESVMTSQNPTLQTSSGLPQGRYPSLQVSAKSCELQKDSKYIAQVSSDLYSEPSMDVRGPSLAQVSNKSDPVRISGIEIMATEKQLSPPMSATESTWLPESKFPHLYDRPKPILKSENCAGALPPRSTGLESMVSSRNSTLQTTSDLPQGRCPSLQVPAKPSENPSPAQASNMAEPVRTLDKQIMATEKQLSPPLSATESTWLPESKFPHLHDHPKPVPKSENSAGAAPPRSSGLESMLSSRNPALQTTSDLPQGRMQVSTKLSENPSSAQAEPGRISASSPNNNQIAQPQDTKSVNLIKTEIKTEPLNNSSKRPSSSGRGQIVVNGYAYEILSLLGRGGSSKVFQVLDPENSQLKAVKCVNLAETDPSICDGYLNEIKLLADLQDGDCVIRMFDHEHHKESNTLFVVMEKGDTDLSRLIKDLKNSKKISATMIAYYWSEMLNAVSFIHKRGTIHSDLKPANFLLVSGRLKLIDFGIASSVQEDMTSVVKDNLTGTYNYISPEALCTTSSDSQQFKISYKSDVWSLGCILYNLVYGRTPFQHITGQFQKLNAIVSSSHKIQFPDPPISNCPSSLIQAMKLCLVRNPKERASVDELIQISYLEQVGPEREIISRIASMAASVGLVQDSEDNRHAAVVRSIQRLIMENERHLPFLQRGK